MAGPSNHSAASSHPSPQIVAQTNPRNSKKRGPEPQSSVPNKRQRLDNVIEELNSIMTDHEEALAKAERDRDAALGQRDRTLKDLDTVEFQRDSALLRLEIAEDNLARAESERDDALSKLHTANQDLELVIGRGDEVADELEIVQQRLEHVEKEHEQAIHQRDEAYHECDDAFRREQEALHREDFGLQREEAGLRREKDAFKREDFALECLRHMTADRDIAIQDHERTFHNFEAFRMEHENVARNHEERFQALEAENNNLRRAVQENDDALRLAIQSRDAAIEELRQLRAALATPEIEDEDARKTDEDSLTTISADSDGLGADSDVDHELYEDYEWL